MIWKQFTHLGNFPPELKARFNSFLTTEFDDSLSVEMQLRSIIKWCQGNFKTVDTLIDFINDISNWLKQFENNFDTKLEDSVSSVLSEWQLSGKLDIVISEALQWQLDDYIATNEQDKLSITTQLQQTEQSINTQLAQTHANVKTFGAVGDGIADDTEPIQNAINAFGSNVFFPKGIYKTTQPLVMTHNKFVSLKGVGRRYASGLISKIMAHHDGNVIELNSATHSGVIIDGLDIHRHTDFSRQGNAIHIDSLSRNAVSSHITIKNCYIHNHDNGIHSRGLIYGTFDSLNISSNKVGIFFNGRGGDVNTTTNNALTMLDVRVNGNDYGIYIDGSLRNLTALNTSFETSKTGLYISEDSPALNVSFDTMWFELQELYCMDIRGGANLTFKNIRLADNKPLFRADTFKAINVTVDTLFGSSSNVRLGTSQITARNIKRISTTNAVRTDTEEIEVINDKTMAHTTPYNQVGNFSKNYIAYWTPSRWSYVGAQMIGKDFFNEDQSALFNSTNSASFSMVLSGFPFATNQPVEIVFWVKGKGQLEVATEGDGNGYKKLYEIETTTWKRIVTRTKVSDIMTKLTALFFIPRVETGNELLLTRPGVYASYNNIDSRPANSFGGAEYGLSDYDTYKTAERNHKNIVVYAASIPVSGTWLVGDKVKNTTPASGGYEGWICVTAGTPGTWKGYGLIA